MNEEELMRRHGEIGTFFVRVTHTQNHSWQGVITWADKNVSVPFKSALELFMQIQDVVGGEEGGEEEMKSLTQVYEQMKKDRQ